MHYTSSIFHSLKVEFVGGYIFQHTIVQFQFQIGIVQDLLGLHMGPDNLCYVTRHVSFFPYVIMSLLYDLYVTFHSFIKGYVGFLQLLKWPCHTSFFTHVEPYYCWQVQAYVIGYIQTCEIALKVCIQFLLMPRGFCTHRVDLVTCAQHST